MADANVRMTAVLGPPCDPKRTCTFPGVSSAPMKYLPAPAGLSHSKELLQSQRMPPPPHMLLPLFRAAPMCCTYTWRNRAAKRTPDMLASSNTLVSSKGRRRSPQPRSSKEPAAARGQRDPPSCNRAAKPPSCRSSMETAKRNGRAKTRAEAPCCSPEDSGGSEIEGHAH